MENTTSTRTALATLNASPSIRTWGKYTLESRYAVGSQSKRWTNSPKIHVLSIAVVIEDREPKPGTYKVGSVFAAHALCNGNGQHTGTAKSDLDTDRVTCERCIKQMGWDA